MVKDIEQYLTEVKNAYSDFKPKKHLFFRGHSSCWFRLCPSVFRNPFYNEKDIVLDFKQYAPFHNINYDFIDERDKVLADMQHYEIPTRLLDWTLAPLNALFFACLENKEKDGKEKDGQVIIFDPWKYWKEIVRDKEVPEIHNIHILSRALLSGGWDFGKIAKYISKKYDYESLKPEDIYNPFAYVASYTNNRILHQRGCFTIHGICKEPLETFQEAFSCIRRINIEAKYKASLLKELNYLYVNHYSIYPDFDGMQKMIKAKGSLFNIHSVASQMEIFEPVG